MMKGIFAHNILFRLVFPPIYGLLVYVLVLLIFDGIHELETNFFSQEAMLCVGLTYALTESLSMVLRFVNRSFPEFKSVKRRIFIYLTANLLCSLVVISAGVEAYFIFIVGYSNFQVEFITLNAIFLASTVLYTLVYFGLFYLNHYNQRRLEQETTLREKMEYQLSVLKSEVNPQLLYTSLETLINLVHQNPDEADNFINCLSRIYRYSLEYRRQELAPLTQEIQAAENVVELYNYTHQQNICLHLLPEDDVVGKQLIPGTLQKLAEHAITRSLITEHRPLHLHIRININGQLLFRYELHERLVKSTLKTNIIAELQQAYSFFTNQPLECNEENNQVSIRVPFLKIENLSAKEEMIN
jgi:two-component system LytT family sensor kinase